MYMISNVGLSHVFLQLCVQNAMRDVWYETLEFIEPCRLQHEVIQNNKFPFPLHNFLHEPDGAKSPLGASIISLALPLNIHHPFYFLLHDSLN